MRSLLIMLAGALLSPPISAALAPWGVAYAQAPLCPTGNLLAKSKAHKSVGAASTVRLTDNVVSAEGDPWRTAVTTVFADDSAHVVFDLGAVTQVDAIYVQGDNNDTYQVDISTDGVAYEPIWTVPMHPNAGMRARTKVGLGATGRYLRVGNGRGDKAYSLSEVQAFCGEQALWPPPVTEKKTDAEEDGDVSRKVRNARGKMLVAVLGLVIFIGLLAPGLTDPTRIMFAVGGATAMVGYVCYRVIEEKGVPSFGSSGVWMVGLAFGGWLVWLFLREGDRTMLALKGACVWVILCSATVWINYGTFHGSRAVHYWDSFHYYMGSKYFKETRYDYLYACSNIGEIDDGHGGVMKRHVRDLRNNALLPAEQSLAGMSTICHDRFTPERWAAFRQDLRLFRSYMGGSWWAKMFKDHGYNATPVWNMVGHTFANIGWADYVPPAELENSPANTKGKSKAERKLISDRFAADRDAFETRIKTLSSIDFILYGGIFALIFWAFGLRVCALAMLIWGCGYPWAYFWTGGGYGRVPWLFMATAGLCLLKRGYPLLAGFAFTWTALLRVFPGALIAGVSAVIGDRIIRGLRGEPQVADGPKLLRGVSHRHRRLILGCFLGLAVLVPLSLPAADGSAAYGEFLHNSFKHKGTPLTNHMGLPTLLSFHPSYIGKKTKNPKLDDPFLIWKQKRVSTLASRKWLHYGLIALLLAWLALAGRKLEDWEVTAASVIACIFVFELTCYYYNFIVLFVPLALRRMRYVVALIGMTIATQYVQLNVGWYDEQYLWESVVVLGAMLYVFGDITWRAFRPPTDEAPTPAPAPQAATP